MAAIMIHGISQKISFKQYIMCGLWVYSYCFTKKMCFFPTGVKGLNIQSKQSIISRSVGVLREAYNLRETKFPVALKS